MEKKGQMLNVKDKRGRILLRVDNDNKKVAVGRFPDLDENCKKHVIKVYNMLVGKDCTESLSQFLNYQDEGENEEFCS